MAKTLRKRKVAKAYGIKVKTHKLKTGIIKDKYGNLAYKFTTAAKDGRLAGGYSFGDSNIPSHLNERRFSRDLGSFVHWLQRVNYKY